MSVWGVCGVCGWGLTQLSNKANEIHSCVCWGVESPHTHNHEIFALQGKGSVPNVARPRSKNE